MALGAESCLMISEIDKRKLAGRFVLAALQFRFYYLYWIEGQEWNELIWTYMNIYELTPLKILVFPLVGPSLSVVYLSLSKFQNYSREWGLPSAPISTFWNNNSNRWNFSTVANHIAFLFPCVCLEKICPVGIFAPAECTSASLVTGSISSTNINQQRN